MIGRDQALVHPGSGTERCRTPLPPSQNASLPFSGYFCVCLEHRGHGCPGVWSSVNSLLFNPKGKTRAQPSGHLSHTSRPLYCLKGKLPTRSRGQALSTHEVLPLVSCAWLFLDHVRPFISWIQEHSSQSQVSSGCPPVSSDSERVYLPLWACV